MSTLPLQGRTALVTGVSRRRGIGYAVAARLADLGASLYLQHYSPHDAEQAWGAEDVRDVVAGVREHLVGDARLADGSGDLAVAETAGSVVEDARAALGHLDLLACIHARSGGDGRLEDVGAAELDGHWQVNARSTLLLTRAFAAKHDGRPGGRVVWMTSGQHEGPMTDEIAYATSKAALAGITRSVANGLADRGIGLNTVNPGPVNTGYLDDDGGDRSAETRDWVRRHFPGGRFGRTDDVAGPIAWLLTDEAAWVVGQVLSMEGGFRRWESA